jgi:adenylate cyclase, class 2
LRGKKIFHVQSFKCLPIYSWFLTAAGGHKKVKKLCHTNEQALSFAAKHRMHLNIEFKARSNRNEALEQALQSHNPRFAGEDHQSDTYFNVLHGRMKLREGNIEHALIHYTRSNVAGAKQSDVLLYQHQPDAELKNILTAALGVKVVVAKRRRIYFVDNVKLHFDQVDGLGSFVEVEAIDLNGTIGIEKLQEQCRYFAQLFGIGENDYVGQSYSDLMLTQKELAA